jgi:hypothetical protein
VVGLKANVFGFIAFRFHMQNKLLILSMILLLSGGCDGIGEDWLGKSVAAFAPQRDDLNEAKELIKALAATEGISGLLVR